MQTATQAASAASILIAARPDHGAPIFRAEGRNRLFLRSGVVIAADKAGIPTGSFEEIEVEIPSEALEPGSDFYIRMDGGRPVAFRPCSSDTAGVLGGFHFAPGGNATARAGGDDIPAINPYSVWDAGFRPACPDPRGMALVIMPAVSLIWVDIYKLNVDHIENGTSRFGATIADGRDLPVRTLGKGKYPRLDYAAAVEIYAHHGKQLLSYDEFRAAAFGVTEKTSADDDPETTGLDAARTSRFGIMQATGNLWDWGHDGDPDNPRASIFGGSWFDGSHSGSRYAYLVYWPGNSYGCLSARGRSDHSCLMPA